MNSKDIERSDDGSLENSSDEDEAYDLDKLVNKYVHSNYDEDDEIMSGEPGEETVPEFDLNKIVNMTELKKYTKVMREMMSTSDRSVRHYTDSIRYIEQTADLIREPTYAIIAEVTRLNRMMDNLNVAVPVFEELARLVDLVDGDKLKIKQGPRTTIGEYVQKLEKVKGFDRFAWINQIEYKPIKDAFSREKTLRAQYTEYVSLIDKGEKILVQEFIGTVDFYSSEGRMFGFFEFLMHHFNEADLGECIKTLLNEVKDVATFKTTLNKTFLFVSNESTFKLAKICTWFLAREADAELYDENREQHVDIHEKLNYGKMRFEFVRNALVIHAKLTSLGYKRDITESFKKNFTKLLNTVSPSKSIISQLAKTQSDVFNSKTQKPEKRLTPSKLNRPMSIMSQMSEKSNDSSLELDFEDVPLKDPSNSKPIDYLELYLEDLNFNLRLLLHEITLIEIIFEKSPETQSQLVAELKSMFVNVIDKEFEHFFEKKLDLAKISPFDDAVVVLVVLMLSRINRMKEKLSVAAAADDIESSSRLLRFMLKTSEICAPVFQTYLDTIKRPAQSEEERSGSDLPSDFGIHGYLVKVCTVWRAICLNERAVANAIRIGFMNVESKSAEKEPPQSATAQSSSAVEDEGKQSTDTFGKILSRTKKFAANIEQMAFKRSGTKSGVLEGSADNESEKIWYLGKYYLILIQHLEKFLLDETIYARTTMVSKINRVNNPIGGSVSSSNRFITLTSSQELPSSFLTELANMKLNVFLANNFEFVQIFIEQMQLGDALNRVQENYATESATFIKASVEQACDVFKSIAEKWRLISGTVTSPTLPNTFSFPLNETDEPLTNSISPNETVTKGNQSKMTTTEEQPQQKRGLFSKIKKNPFQNPKGTFNASRMTPSSSSPMSPSSRQDNKRRDQVILMVSELISSCSKIVVTSSRLSDMLRQKMLEHGILDVFVSLETNNYLRDILEKMQFRFSAQNSNTDNSSVSAMLLNELFICAKV